MIVSIRLLMLVLALVQGVGFCACRLDDSCHSEQSDGCSCPECDHDSPSDGDCVSHHQHLREARLNAPDSFDFLPTVLQSDILPLTTFDPTLALHSSEEASPPKPSSSGITLPLLN